MSHYSDFSLVVLEKAEIANYFGEQLADLFIGHTTFSSTGVAKKRLWGITRSDWFKWMIGNLLDKTPFNHLQFLSENACTHIVLKNDDGIVEESYLDSLNEQQDEYELEFMTHLYTVISPEKIGMVLNEIDHLFLWCNEHIDIVSDVLEEAEQDVKNAINNAQCYERVNDALYGEDGDGSNFLFCALKSIQGLLAYAQLNQLYAVYENENYTGLEWLKRCRPHIINFC